MSVRGLAVWFWGEVLERPLAEDHGHYKHPQFKIILRHAKLLLGDGLEEAGIKSTILAMKEMGKTVNALTCVRWDAGGGRTFYDVVHGSEFEPVPIYDEFAMLEVKA